MTPTLLFVVLGLAVWRVTHLIIDDNIPIVARPREWVLSKVKPDGNLDYLLGCTYCMGVWVALPAAVLWYFVERADRVLISNHTVKEYGELISRETVWSSGVVDWRTLVISLAVWMALAAFAPIIEALVTYLYGDD